MRAPATSATYERPKKIDTVMRLDLALYVPRAYITHQMQRGAVEEDDTMIDELMFRVVASGCERFERLPGADTDTVERRITHALRLIHGRDVRGVREVAPRMWRGLVGRSVSTTIEIAPRQSVHAYAEVR